MSIIISELIDTIEKDMAKKTDSVELNLTSDTVHHIEILYCKVSKQA